MFVNKQNQSRRFFNVVTYLLLITFLSFTSMYSCQPEPVLPDDPEVNVWLDDHAYPPQTQSEDLVRRQKADVIVLPSISITVWAIGAISAYIGAHLIYQSTASDMGSLIGEVFGQSQWNEAQWEQIDWATEAHTQATHLETSLDLVAYRSPDSDFYAITGNDYIRMLNQSYYATIVSPDKLKELLDGKVRPLGGYAKEYFQALRAASMQARHFSAEAQGLCVQAEVTSIKGQIPYLGLAKAHNHVDVIPAAILASLKATVRCGMFDVDIVEFVNGYFKVSGQRGATIDIFISHMLRTARLIYKYVDVCQLPPKLTVTLDKNDCNDTFNP